MTELIWEGKYDKDGHKVAPLRVQLPFQTVETVNESAQERQRMLDMFGSSRPSEWRNRLIWGDKKYVLPALLEEFAGQVNLIYIDPPFDTGQDFSFKVNINGDDFTKEPSIIEQKAYRDTWGVTAEERQRGASQWDSYLQWFYETVIMLRELMADTGSIYVHMDWHIGHYAKAVLDEIFGRDNFVNEIVREKCNPKNYTRNAYGNIHDVIFFYRKSEIITWEKPHSERSVEKVGIDFPEQEPESGRWYKTRPIHAPGVRHGLTGKKWRGMLPPQGKHWQYIPAQLDRFEAEGRIQWSSTGNPRLKVYADESKGVFLQDIWLGVKDFQNHGYATEKNEEVLERIIQASSNEGDLVLDCFVGSGTTAAVAEKLGRRWIACDLGRFAIHTTRKRLLSTLGVKPFIVQNLGKYERQLWQAAEFGEQGEERMLAYRCFILELYHAQPVGGYSWLHGIKAGRMVHVGVVDSPVTPSDVTQIAGEFRRAMGTGKDAPKTNGVDVLGWDFAFELNEVAKQQAAQANINMRFLRIPREVLEKKAVEQGDIHFFELAALSVELDQKDRSVTLKLTDFVIPPDDVPEDVRQTITHWEQWIDYWSVDWNNQDDTFHNEWQDYRTRREPELQKVVSHTYEQPGTYIIMVKVIDILGNDTTKTLQVEVN